MLKLSNPPAHRAAHADIPKGFLTQLLDRTDLVELVGRSVQLRRQGDNHLGLCPFHGEKSPSFTVSQSKQFFHCFGCGANGDAIHFLREHAGLSFLEAVQELAQAAGMALPGQEQGTTPAQDHTELLKANELAAAFYRHCLRYEQAARDYLKGRRLPSEATERFVIGYAPAGWTSLKEAFPDYRTNSHVVQAGLVVERDEKRYDRFRERIMFGIRDPRGRLLGFGGRSIGAAEPKYLNSSASPLFDKSNALFGVFEAREAIRRTRQVLVVEGYMDVVALSMNGVPNCVATMGTACTRQHIERLMALCEEVVFAFDGDAAGRQAAWKSMLLCLAHADDERVFRFLLLPPGRDPDETILAEGSQAFQARIDRALTLSGFLMQELAQRNNQLASTEDRARFAQEGMEIVRQLPYASNLRRLMREDILKASTLSAQAVSALSASTGAGSHRAISRRRFDPWSSLARAVDTCPKEATEHAQAMLEALPGALQDSFFQERWNDFDPAQAPFWQALFGLLHGSENRPERDTPTDTVDAATLATSRDLLAGAPAMITKHLADEHRRLLRSAFRQGSVNEEDYLRELASANAARGARQHPG
ncbi:MAG TPA: DNA primase [Xanthomonadales bacterium]|nr:DNA primase [Xanthomonadales bacterium]